MRECIVDLVYIKRTCKKNQKGMTCSRFCPFLDEYEECSLEELSKQPSEWDLRKFKGEEDDF